MIAQCDPAIHDLCVRGIMIQNGVFLYIKNGDKFMEYETVVRRVTETEARRRIARTILEALRKEPE